MPLLGGTTSASYQAAPPVASVPLLVGTRIISPPDVAATAATAAGTLDLAGTVTAVVSASATGSISLGGTVTGQAAATTAGSITLGGTATGTAAGSGSTVAIVHTTSGTAASGSTSLTVNFTVPTAGNLLVFAVGTDKAMGAANAIAGWTLLTSQSGTSTSHAIWYKVATGSETTVTGTWTTASTSGDTGIVVELSGADTSSPIPGSSTPTYSDTASTTIALDPPAATTAGSMALAFVSIDTVTTPPWNITATGWTRDLTAGGAGAPANLAVLHYDTALTAGQDLASQTFTSPVSDQMSGSVLVVAAAAGGGGATPATASGGITLGGTVTAQAAATATGAMTLGGSISATARASAAATITLGGSVTARASATTSGAVTLGGTVTALVPATAAGLITLSGLATAQAAAYVTHTYVTAVITDNAGTAVLAGDGTSTSALAVQQLAAAALAASPPAVATLADTATSTAALTGDGTSTAALTDLAALSILQTTT